MIIPPASGLVSYTITANGAQIPDTYQVVAIHIAQSINGISTATITILDGSPSSESFAVSSSSTFVPGVAISIALGYDGNTKTVFSGIVTQQSLRVNAATGPMLDVICQDKAIKMTVGRKSATYSQTLDSTVMTHLIQASGLNPNVTPTAITLPQLAQYTTSDWDFMLARAELNSMLVSTINGTVKVFNPTTDTASVLALTYGVNIFDFNADLNSVTQYAKVSASAWDYSTQTRINASAINNLPGPGNISSETLAGVVGLDNFELQTTPVGSSDELSAWTEGQMLKSELSKILGDVRFQGNSSVLPGNYVTLTGLGARFDGNHFVSAVQHQVRDGNWITKIRIGMDSIWCPEPNPVEAPAPCCTT
jgi:phage protein D